jgi:Domain of unknown function (DUF4333)
MQTSQLRRAGLILAPVSCAVLISACGTEVIDKSAEVHVTKLGLAAAHAGPAKSIDCPSNVNAKVGQTLTCHVTLQQGGVDFTMKVDHWNGSHGHLTIVAAKRTA